MDILTQIKDAKEVFYYFSEIAKIPHGSGDTAKIADYLVDFATKHSLYVRRDEANNVIIKKSATAAYEGRPPVIIQGHTDMVLAKTAESEKDLKAEGLDLYVDGDFLKARGTTLGGDDGVAVAYALALLASEDIPHPEIEAIFTSDEEIGLLGAVALDPYDIKSRVMINIDSDSEGVFTVGCAGGARIDVSLNTEKKKRPEKTVKLTVSGLTGGHSGVEINKGRHNAIKILAELLGKAGKPISVGALFGGNADNAIPRNAECLVSKALSEKIEAEIPGIYEKYREKEPNMVITVYEADDATLFTEASSEKIIALINEEPSGVIKMSEDIEGLVETSLNLGILDSSDEYISISFSIRSAKGEEKANLATRVTKIAEKYGAKCDMHGEYPAWEYRSDSHLRDTMCRIYENTHGEKANVVIIHAGLECGIFAGKLEGLDCVSIGPDNYDIHTTDERLSISSTVRVWNFLLEVLKNI